MKKKKKRQKSWRAGNKGKNTGERQAWVVMGDHTQPQNSEKSGFHFSSFFSKNHFTQKCIQRPTYRERKGKGGGGKTIHELRIKLHLYKNRSF